MKKIIEYLRKEGAQPLATIRLELGMSMEEAETQLKILHVKDVVEELLDVSTGVVRYQLLPGGEAAGREADKRIRVTTSPGRKEYDKRMRYSEGKVCPKCGALITNTATLCHKCAAKKRYEKQRKAGEAIITAKPEPQEEAIVEVAEEAETQKTKPPHRIDFELQSMLQQEHTKVEELSRSLARHKESVQFAAETVTRLEAEAESTANRNRQMHQEIEDLERKVEAEARVLRWYATVLVSTVRAGEKMAREK